MVRVKKEFENKIQVKWVEDIAFNIIQHGELKYGNDKVCSIDSKSLRSYFKFYNTNGDQKFINHQIGNRPEFQTWGISLITDTVKFEFPWYYSRDETLGLPLYYSCSDKHWSHVFVYQNSISKLLRMRQKNESGEYEIVPVDLKYLHVEDRIQTLKDPEIYGVYIKLLADEESTYKCWTKDNKYGDFYIEDVVAHTSDNTSEFGKNLSVEIKENAIAHTMIWMCENKTATDLGNLSNYTTNIYDQKLGFDPIINTTFHVGSYDLFKELPADYTGSLFYREFKGKPIEPGYHVYSFCRDSNSINAKVGINMSELTGKLTVKLKDRNPALMQIESETGNTIESKSAEKPEFFLHVYLLVTRKISFFADEAERDKWVIRFNSTLFRENSDISGD